jgi:hypothetical protein
LLPARTMGREAAGVVALVVAAFVVVIGCSCAT